MQYAYTNNPAAYPAYQKRMPEARTSTIACRWTNLRAQLLLQWQRLNASDIDQAGPNRHRLAILIQGKYGIDAELVENYLRNFERTLPVM